MVARECLFIEPPQSIMFPVVLSCMIASQMENKEWL